jgi:capsular polysaccharide biosynthesis protein
VDVTEAAVRLVRVRGIIVVGLLAVGLAAGYAVHRLEAQTYTATARLVVNRTVPQDASEAQAMAGTVEGIVTSPDRVTAALRSARISRDLLKFTKNINAQPLGDSGIVALSVTDTSAAAAARVADTLAADAITTINQPDQAADQLAAQLQSQIDGLTAQTKALDSEIKSTDDPVQKAALSAQRSDITQQLATLSSKLVDLHQQQTQSPQAGLVDAAATPVRADPSRLPLDLIIGGLAGLIAGIALAAVVELARPTVVGESALERALGAPVLGTFSFGRPASDDEILALSARVRHAARRARVHTVLLWSPARSIDLRELQSQLQAAQSRATARLPAAVAVRLFGLAGAEPSDAALLVVTPAVLPLRDAERAQDLSTAHGLPLLGAAVCLRHPRQRIRAARGVAATASEAVAS